MTFKYLVVFYYLSIIKLYLKYIGNASILLHLFYLPLFFPIIQKKKKKKLVVKDNLPTKKMNFTSS